MNGLKLFRPNIQDRKQFTNVVPDFHLIGLFTVHSTLLTDATGDQCPSSLLHSKGNSHDVQHAKHIKT